jgi:hypothetical protein
LVHMFLESAMTRQKPLVAHLTNILNGDLCFIICQPRLGCICFCSAPSTISTSNEGTVAELYIHSCLELVEVDKVFSNSTGTFPTRFASSTL